MWKASANPGLSWMVKANGGPWPITTEALRRRRLREGWRKHGPVQGGTDAGVGCCEVSRPEGAHGGLFEPARGFAGLDPAEGLDDLCDELLVQHRRDWIVFPGPADMAPAPSRRRAPERRPGGSPRG